MTRAQFIHIILRSYELIYTGVYLRVYVITQTGQYCVKSKYGYLFRLYLLYSTLILLLRIIVAAAFNGEIRFFFFYFTFF